jgi:DNA modification methylase
MITWKIEKRNIEDLQGYDKNPRKFTDKGLKDLKKSLQNCGDANIITINADNTVLGGHARLTVMKQLGYTEVDVKVPEKQLSEKQVQEVVVRLNANTAGEWDLDKLQADFELDELQEWGLDIEFTELEEEKEIIEDEVPEEVETRAKRGDIWQLGNHRLMCGDSTSITDVEKLMNGEKADMVFTDMPYGMGLNTDYSSLNWNGRKGKKYEQGKVDDFTPEMVSNLFACFDYVKEVFLWGADYFAELLPNKNDGSWIVWDKTLESNGDAGSNSEFELCWSKQKHKREVIHFNWFRFFGLSQQDVKTRIHPTQKPIQVIQPILTKYSKDNQKIVDLFGGSGSTLIACEQLNRKCFMMELDEHYCDVIITRWENLTGQKAVLCS